MRTKITNIVILTSLLVSINCQKPEDVALLTAPITYAIAKNAIQMKKKDGAFNIRLTFQNIIKESNNWPSGEIYYEVESAEYPNKIYSIQYILNGSHLATAIVTEPNKNRKQLQVNLVESAVVFGQTESVELEFEKLVKNLISEVDKSRKIAVFEFPGTLNEKTLLGKRIGDSITTYLVKEKYQVVERKSLELLFNEAKFQNSGLVGDDARIELGKLLGANTILIGNIKNERHDILINARIVDLQSGLILSSGQRVIPKYFFQEKDLAVIQN